MGRVSACYHGGPGDCAVCAGLDRRRRANEASRGQDWRARSGDEWTAALRATHRQDLAELRDERHDEHARRLRIGLVLSRWSGRRRGNWTA
jgi:hypothetical protein